MFRFVFKSRVTVTCLIFSACSYRFFFYRLVVMEVDERLERRCSPSWEEDSNLPHVRIPSHKTAWLCNGMLSSCSSSPLSFSQCSKQVVSVLPKHSYYTVQTARLLKPPVWISLSASSKLRLTVTPCHLLARCFCLTVKDRYLFFASATIVNGNVPSCLTFSAEPLRTKWTGIFPNLILSDFRSFSLFHTHHNRQRPSIQS